MIKGVKWTVIGLYEDGHRYAQAFECESVAEAIALAHAECGPGFEVAGVLPGDQHTADEGNYGSDMI